MITNPSPSKTAATESVGEDGLSSGEEQPLNKKAKGNDAKRNTTSWVGRQGSTQIPLRSPLPKRVNCVINPGAPDQKNTRHTSVQVTAEKERQAKLKHDLEALKQQQIELLAQMQVDQEMDNEVLQWCDVV